ncbi:DNA polymerase zeta catalytic subunit [Strongyloides ratti]|uniref:DNA polymerase n=1 Tax=Strongyloides ratti TaxID=34506 RepID=A0A090MX53_STRRB|nr:DNA polymerase zeta catalytic subunit [Strongyloides ratti]CEF64834.1 DNA polymerase zeta catalytic subunit [Strongyloides ratti]
MDWPCQYTKLIINKIIKQKVPVIRMFGISKEGHKCTAHIHGVLPYIIIKVGDIDQTQATKNIFELFKKITSTNKNQWIREKDITEHIFKIEFFESKSIYGYYQSMEVFAKIYFYNPILCNMVFISLQKMSDDSFDFQPYNGTMPYINRFFVDYNIFGMDIVDFEKVYYRPDKDCIFNHGGKRIKTDEIIIPLSMLSTVQRTAYEGIEFDTIPQNIINKKVFFDNIRNPGIDAIWKEEEERCWMRNTKIPEPKIFSHAKEFVSRTEKEDLKVFGDIIRKLRKNVGNHFNDTIMNASLMDASQIPGETSFFQIDDNMRIPSPSQIPVGQPSDTEEEEDDDKINYEEIMDEKYEDSDFGFDQDVYNIESSDEDRDWDMLKIIDEKDSNKIISFDDNFDDYYDFNNKPKTKGFDEIFKYGVIITPDGELYSEKKNQTQFFGNISFANQTIKEKKFEKMDVCKEKEKNILQHKYDNSSFLIKNLSVMSMELITDSRSKKYSNPETDEIVCLSLCLYNDACVNTEKPDYQICLINRNLFKDYEDNINLDYIKLCTNETHILQFTMTIVKIRNPDIIVGYEMNRESWGYFIDRCKVRSLKVISKLSKIETKEDSGSNFVETKSLPEGRIPLNIWKIVSKEHSLRSYDFHNVVYKVLLEKFQKIPFEKMSSLKNQTFSIKKQIIKNLHKRNLYNMKILSHMGTLIKTSEMAKVYGIQFLDALTRGSQFRVESMLYRQCLKENYVGPSVSVHNRVQMPSPEIFPLVMEPTSGIYRSPILVLDFQSLYPSMCMAYNYCFSTCLGRINEWGNYIDNCNDKQLDLQIGALRYRPKIDDIIGINNIKKNFHITPVGSVFVKEGIRKGVIPTLLEELLSTRQMIKTMMKIYKNDKHLYKILDARQLSLKLLANVTYGYTAANFSGKMPCFNVSDAIVSSGRCTLERAITTIETKCKDLWSNGLEIVYGDTDSIFVHVLGNCPMEKAFEIGNEIARRITKENPSPVVLKFEKVMKPCVLLTKKRYVGYSYESIDQEEPIFDAKGIESVRRDNCAFVSKEVEKFLKILFEKNMNEALSYIKNRLLKIDKIPFNQFIISSTFRGEFSQRAVVPAKKIKEQRALIHERYTPLIGSRIQYVVKEPNLIDKIKKNKKNLTVIANVIEPEEFLNNGRMRLNYDYYVQNMFLPALNRITNLEEIDVVVEIPIYRKEFCDICEDVCDYQFDERYGNIKSDCLLNLIQKHSTYTRGKKIVLNKCAECIGEIESCNTACQNYSCSIKQLHIKLDEGLRETAPYNEVIVIDD